MAADGNECARAHLPLDEMTPSERDTFSRQHRLNDEHIVVDGAVARLCKRAPEMGDFVWLYYAAKWPAKRIGNRYDMSEAKAREIIKTGVGWIDCSLEKFIEAA